MKNIVIIPNKTKDSELTLTNRVANTLLSFGAKIFIHEKYSDFRIDGAEYYCEFPINAEAIIVIGGDGSMLDASVWALQYDIPMLGVNLGKIGYLNELEPENLPMLKKLFTDEYKLQEKMLISAECLKRGETVASERLAVNDIVILHDNHLGISHFTLKCKEGSVKYRADGIIVSTPAGSTAYSLSAGGPIVSHNVSAMLVTPMCPHSFFDRSILFSAEEELSIENSSEAALNISIDGRNFEKLMQGESLKIAVSDKKLKVISFTENNMFSALFRKMRMLEGI